MHVRVPEKLLQKAESISRENGFSNVQEFFRDSLRKSVEEQEIREKVLALERLKGSVKNIKRMTRKEHDKWFKEVYLKTNPSETFRKYNL